jgi:hypothetical protein
MAPRYSSSEEYLIETLPGTGLPVPERTLRRTAKSFEKFHGSACGTFSNDASEPGRFARPREDFEKDREVL